MKAGLYVLGGVVVCWVAIAFGVLLTDAIAATFNVHPATATILVMASGASGFLGWLRYRERQGQ